ncbi:hypothetical protein [Acinetobacter baumannii]|uniref:HD domain-containing protein n=1 Tax=Acinetobacter baumannii TaxID=470 RepID=UPI00101EFDEB|nr:hypothetical protein [Acinetobacter baumannii]RYL17098.1 hypothetical protein EWO92_11375 [Acinetobacter baumannii]RYL30527.1 hypothetical protein EWO96_10295 [Acinetobacter baumannii]RYL44462.1 hypothetical protein EWP49_11370 [Acinetobacter baumannii]
MSATEKLLPLEIYLERKSREPQNFPHNKTDYFERYKIIKNYLAANVYPHIHAGTSAEDGGVYTDHSINHFNAVITYLGKLIDIDIQDLDKELQISPYEIYIALVAILLHDAGNIFGRQGHEKKTYQIMREIGPAACPDNFEGRRIGKIATAHGGKFEKKDGNFTKDTISQLDEIDSLGGISFRPRLIAALVRFADEICEDRSRGVKYLLARQALPKFSEVFHQYAESISSVDVDFLSKRILIKFEIEEEDAKKKFGKGDSNNVEEVYLIDEINMRLEKMFHELIYCKNFMYEVCPLNKIRADITIYSDNMDDLQQSFELEQSGYPNENFSFSVSYPHWKGEKIVEILTSTTGV